MKFSLNLGSPEKKIKIITHAFCDKKDFNAQNLNAREIAYRLNPDLLRLHYSIEAIQMKALWQKTRAPPN